MKPVYCRKVEPEDDRITVEIEGQRFLVGYRVYPCDFFDRTKIIEFSTGWRLEFKQGFYNIDDNPILHFLLKCCLPHPFRNCEAMNACEVIEDEIPIMGKQVIEEC